MRLGRFLKPWLVSPLLLVVVITVPILRSRGNDGEPTQGIQPQQTEVSTMAPASVTNRIGFVGQDGNIYTISPEGTEVMPLITDASPNFQFRGDASNIRELRVYTWPTWSPDSRWLAYSGVHIELPGRARVELFTYEQATRNQVRIHIAEGANAPVIGPGMPHYMHWSPDSQLLAFIALTPAGLTLFQSPPGSQTTQPTDLPPGGPLYFDWSPTSEALVIHQREQHFLMDRAGHLLPNAIPEAAPQYLAPAWSADGERVALIGASDEGAVLYTVDAQGEGRQEVKSVQGGSILWSPVDGRKLAFTESALDESGITRGLSLLDLDTGQQQELTREPVLAFFWSPDGQRIVYLTRRAGERVQMVTWRVIKLGEPVEVTTLVDFLPSQPLAASLLFFDQFAHSHTLWAPDSRYLVLTGYLVEDDLQGPSHVIVVDSDGEEPPRVITEGTLAFWSPS